MNFQQTAAAESTAANVLCLAGPGSGKTTTLVAAVARRCRESGPGSVLCITFTVAGACEMRERLDKLGIEGLGFCGTLHSFLLRMLRKYHALVGLPADVAVVDEDVASDLLGQVMRDMGSKASLVKMVEMISTPRLILGIKKPSDSREELVVIELHRKLKRDGLLTLDALLVYGKVLIEEIRSERAAVGEADWWQFKHLFVDEFQDSAKLDAEIYDAMPCETKFKVGDPDQAIYGFRGGDVESINNEAWLGSSELHRLETNYRCLNRIAEAAQRLIEHNSLRVVKKTTSNSEGGAIMIDCWSVPIEEMNGVAWRASKLTSNDQVKPEEIAVLCRTRREVEAFVPFLKSQGIKVASDDRPALPRDWRAAKLLVAALANPCSDMAWLTLIEAIDGREFAARVKSQSGMRMTSVCTEAQQWSPKYSKLELPALSALLSSESREKLHDACRELSANGEWSLADLSAYLRSGEQRTERTAGVFVGTVHSAKGREWDAVFMVGMEEGNFPQARRDSDIEEERRLAFVGMTRARKWLFLSSCSQRPQNRGQNQPPGPMETKSASRFIKESGL